MPFAATCHRPEPGQQHCCLLLVTAHGHVCAPLRAAGACSRGSPCLGGNWSWTVSSLDAESEGVTARDLPMTHLVSQEGHLMAIEFSR